MTGPARRVAFRLVVLTAAALPLVHAPALAQNVLEGGPAEEPEPIGYVSRVEGIWTSSEDTAYVGRRVLPNEAFAAQGAEVDGSVIAFVLVDGTRYEHSCPESDPTKCTWAVPVERLEEASIQDWFARALRVVRRHIWDGESDRYESLITRGAGLLGAAVLELEGSRVNLSSLLADAPSGWYEFRLASLSEPVAERPTATVRIDWEPSAPDLEGSVRAPGVRAGLYEATVSRAPSSEMRGGTLWMLLAPSARASTLQERVRRVDEITEAWGLGESDPEVITFRLGFFEHLASDASADGR